MINNVNLFWSSFNIEQHPEVDIWKNSNAKLSPFHALTLYSQTKYGNNVFLWTYQNINPSLVPSGVIIKNANDILPINIAFNALKIGHSIAHISDAVRLKASAENNGIVCDMDLILLKQFPEVEGFFSTMFAKKTGGMVPKFGKDKPPFLVHDGSWDGKALAMFPVKISEFSKQATLLLSERIINTLSVDPKKDSKAWNYVMWALKDISRYDKEAPVYKPIAFCPIPGWLSKGNCYSIEYPSRLKDNNDLFGNEETIIFGQKFPTINEILNDSYGVQHFFESTFHKSMIGNDRNFWFTIKDGTLLSEEAKKIVGPDWREKLTNITNLLLNN